MIPKSVGVLSDEVGTIGGAAKATLLLCEALAGAGSSVTLFVTTPPNRATRVRLGEKGIVLELPPIPMGSRFQIPARSLAVRAWRTMQSAQIELLHAVGMQREVSQLLSLPRRFRTVVWETTEALPGNKFIDSRMTGHLSKIDALLVPSRTVAENARKTYGFSGRIAQLPFWVEDRGGRSKAPAKTVPGRLLFVGRMDEDKGFRFLIPAFEKLKSDYPGLTLDICGSGDPTRIASLASLRSGVTARGSVSDDVLDKSYSECIGVVLPSLHEGYPLSLLEACSFGKPVIATTVGSIPEVFAGRDCAFLIPPGDTDALHEAMRVLFAEPLSRYAERCADARRLFEELNSPSAVLKALETAYNA